MHISQLIAVAYDLQGVLHRETRVLASYSLRTTPDGARVPLEQKEGDDRCDRMRAGTKYELTCEHIQIQTLANALAVLLGGPVTDQTGLDGSRDFTLSGKATTRTRRFLMP